MGGADVMFASISSGNCQTLAPLAEDLKVINFMWDCGTQRIFEENDYEYVFRTQANATPEMMAAVIYLLKTKPDFETIAVVNQDYAWGRDSWDIFKTALEALKPEVEVVGEFFPAFGAPDFSDRDLAPAGDAAPTWSCRPRGAAIWIRSCSRPRSAD